MSSTQIKRHETFEVCARIVFEFMQQEWVTKQPENLRISGANELVDGFFRAVNATNGKKAAGEIKTSALNYLREKYKIDLNVQQPHTTEEWESEAWNVYCRLYSARWDEEALVRGTSRMLRKFELYGALPTHAPEVHYRPVKEVITRFYGKVIDGHHGFITAPDIDPAGYILELDGSCAKQMGGMLPITIEEYLQKKVPHDHTSPRV